MRIGLEMRRIAGYAIHILKQEDAFLFGKHYIAMHAAMTANTAAIPAIVYGALWIPIPGVAIKQEHHPEIISSRIRIANSGFMAANILFGAGMIALTFPNNYYFIFIVSRFHLHLLTLSQFYFFLWSHYHSEVWFVLLSTPFSSFLSPCTNSI